MSRCCSISLTPHLRYPALHRKELPVAMRIAKNKILKTFRAFCLIALPRCLNETFPSSANLIFTPANSPGAHNGVTSKSDCFCRSSHGWRFCRSVQEEWRRGSSYKVGLTAAGGSRVNAHSLTPTLASVPACTGKYSTYTWHCSSFTGKHHTGKCSYTYTA